MRLEELAKEERRSSPISLLLFKFQAKLDKMRLEELAKEERRRSRLPKEAKRDMQRESESMDNDEEMKVDAYHIGNGYVEMVRYTLFSTQYIFCLVHNL